MSAVRIKVLGSGPVETTSNSIDELVLNLKTLTYTLAGYHMLFRLKVF